MKKDKKVSKSKWVPFKTCPKCLGKHQRREHEYCKDCQLWVDDPIAYYYWTLGFP